MKKIAVKVIALILAAMMVAAVAPAAMFAETAPQNGLPEGVTVDWNVKGSWNHSLTFTITIGEGVNVDRINLGDLMERADFAEIGYLPASVDTYTFEVIDNSGNGYTYEPQSITLSTPEFHVYERGGYSTVMNRCYNAALGALGCSKKDADMEHDVIGAKLKEKGYGTADMDDAAVTAEYLDDYYVDYYNENYNGNATTLSEVSEQFLIDMMKVNENLVVRENNMTVAQYMGYRYLYEVGYGVDVIGDGNYVPFMQYTDKNTEAYASLDELFNGLAGDTEKIFKTQISGPLVWNHYQNFIIEQSLTFNLVKPGCEKISVPGIDKKIVLPEEEVIHDDIAAGEDVNFVLRSNIGEDFTAIFDGIDYPVVGGDPNDYGYNRDDFGSYSFAFHDSYDPAFVIDEDSFVVKVKDTVLTAEQYTLTNDVENHKFVVEINDLVQLFLDKVFNYNDIGTAPITVEYAAKTDGMLAGNYVNEAWVVYNETETNHASVDVDTYKISVFKYDQATEAALNGAEFTLYGSKEETVVGEDGTETTITVIDMDNVIATGVSGEDGRAVFDGLDIGVYFVVETKAPNGYVCNSDPQQVTITGNEEDCVVELNFANVEIPHTGGEGTTLFYIVGGAILACAAVMYVVSRRKASDNA